MITKEPKHSPKVPVPPIPPGEYAAVPPGTLRKPFLGPQADENRDPPPNAPVPVNPTATVPNPDEKP